MARALNSDIIIATKELIKHLSGFEENTDAFKYVEKYMLNQLKKADTMSFVNQKDMDSAMSNMAMKFQFHGFFTQARLLKRAYAKYMADDAIKDEMAKLNVIKFLLCMSESPTNKFCQNPDAYAPIESSDDDDSINWGEYLKEGIELWSPKDADDTLSQEDSDETGESDLEMLQPKDRPNLFLKSTRSLDILVDFYTDREQLLQSIQHTWYNKEHVCTEPPSGHKEAKIGILWENYLCEQVGGLVELQTASVISEYKAVRETIWQLWDCHNSFFYQFSRNKLRPKPNATISSVRSMSFEEFLSGFLEYINLMNFFREFFKSIEKDCPCETYKSYSNAIKKNIYMPIYDALLSIEETARKQEETYTLLKLIQELEIIFEPLKISRTIHDQVIIDWTVNTPLKCSTTLLYRLHQSLRYPTSKLEHDIKLTLYLEVFNVYCNITDRWLTKNIFLDPCQEFILTNSQALDDWEINVRTSEKVEASYLEDGILNIIATKVLQIGRNMNFLVRLGKFDFRTDFQETFHDYVVRSTLDALRDYYNIAHEESMTLTEDAPVVNFKRPILGDVKLPAHDDRNNLESLVDVSDGLLLKAFEKNLMESECISKPPFSGTLFEKINKLTRNVFPLGDLIEQSMFKILKERYTISGLMVKQTLIEEYHLEKQLEFLRVLYLFSDANIFVFYTRLFEQLLEPPSSWKYLWLTSNLQDLMMDAYPLFCEKCTIQFKNAIMKELDDPIEICENIDLHYEMEWPLNILVNEQQMTLYKSLFHFILKMKWALYTLTRLRLTDLMPSKEKKVNRTFQDSSRKLQVLKFCLLKILTNVQTYVFSFVYNKSLKKFELDFEKADDLVSLIEAHDALVKNIHSMTVEIERCGKDNYKFRNILQCVQVLQTMWYNPDKATNANLKKCFRIYKICDDSIDHMINQVYLFNLK